MKKRFAVLLALSLTLGVLAGCGDKTNTDGGNTTESQKESAIAGATTAAEYESEIPVVDGDVDVLSNVSMSSDYKGLELSVAKQAEVTDEDVETIAIQTYNQMGAKSNVEKSVVESGDTVNIDFEGKKDGVAFEGGTSQGYNLTIGSGSFIDGFEDGLIGVNVGDTVDLNLTFPEGYQNADLAGQDVVFTVTVNFICASNSSEMVDSEIESFTDGTYHNVQEFLDFCREYLEASAKYNYGVAKENAVISQLDDIATVSALPKSLVDKYSLQLTSTMEAQAANYGVDIDTYSMYTNSMDSQTYIQMSAETSARQSMIFQYIAAKENLSIDDAELEEKLTEMASENNYDTVEDMLGDRDKEEFREYFLYEKVVDFICENGNVTEY